MPCAQVEAAGGQQRRGGAAEMQPPGHFRIEPMAADEDRLRRGDGEVEPDQSVRARAAAAAARRALRTLSTATEVGQRSGMLIIGAADADRAAGIEPALDLRRAA